MSTNRKPLLAGEVSNIRPVLIGNLLWVNRGPVERIQVRCNSVELALAGDYETSAELEANRSSVPADQYSTCLAEGALFVNAIGDILVDAASSVGIYLTATVDLGEPPPVEPPIEPPVEPPIEPPIDPPVKPPVIPVEVLLEDQPLPKPDAPVRTATPATFVSIYDAAQPGDHIVLENGDYGGKTLGRKFPAGPYAVTGKPVIIRTANPNGRPDRAPTAANSAVFSTLTITGDGHIVSGVVVQGGGIRIRGSNNRVTRCISRNAGSLLSLGNGEAATDPCSNCLIDHCTLELFTRNAVVFAKANALRRPILSRIWSTDGRGKSPANGGTLISGWSMNNENKYREQKVAPIVRLCYFGPGLQDCHDQTWLHNKVSDTIIACCHATRQGMVQDNFNHRFGLRARFVGNFLPGFEVSWNDHGNWLFGNKFGKLKVRAGKSAAYDDESNEIWAVGGFHAVTDTRIAGNSGAMFLGDNSPSWITNKDPNLGLPDPQPAGGQKPARTVKGNAYKPFAAGDGISIRDHEGAITQAAQGAGGFDWVVNLNSRPNEPAPEEWAAELFAEHPWLEALVPHPADRSTTPWALAQSLTRGDAAKPNTGPFRDSPGGLPA